MAAPYVLIKRLVDNSLSAMLSAIEVYNKPQMTYRDEVTVILVINAWELALKATIRKSGKSVFYKKKQGEKYRSVSLDDALKRVTANNLWPDGVDGGAITANLTALAEYRDRAIHLYNAQGLSGVIYPFLQQNILNFRDFAFALFKRDLAESITWQLLPLGATAPSDVVQFMRVDTHKSMVTEVQDFIDELRKVLDRVETQGGDLARVATIYDINLQSVKKVTGADLVVAVSPTGDGQVIIKKTDPNQVYPFSMKQLLERVNQRRAGRLLTSHDYTVACWKEGLKSDPRFAWKHRNSPSYVWSGDAVSHLASLSDEYFDRLRAEYRARPRST